MQPEQRRLLTFSVLALFTFVGWSLFGPVLFPGLFPEPIPEQAENDVPDPDNPQGDPVAAADPDGEDPDKPPVENPEQPNDPPEPEVILPQHPQQVVTIGSLDPATGYTMSVDLTTTGAAISAATLNDTRYPVAENPDNRDPWPQLKLLGNNLPKPTDGNSGTRRRPHTLDLSVEAIDKQFKEIDELASLKSLDWEVLETEDDPDASGSKTSVTFRIRSPDGGLELRKTYRLNPIPPEQLSKEGIHDSYSPGSQIDVELQIRNLSDAAQVASYVLQGPAGLPLENEENARKFRDIKAGFLSESGDIDVTTMTAGSFAKAFEKNREEDKRKRAEGKLADDESTPVEEWTRPFRFIGVDTQYFAAIVVPAEAQQKRPWFSVSKPSMLFSNTEFRDRSDVSVELQSVELELPPDGLVEHRFQLFLGAKRRELLEAYNAEGIIDFGWFASISHVMVWLLDTFHGWGVPYGLAIVMLTIIVRGCMFPISKKQALSAKRMKELQPQLMELREKYKDDKQKLAQAQMELYRKANFNPFAGCLPVFLQLPIFIALYQALNNWVDLRMASFLWINNLAAPDALVPDIGFSLPFLGSQFNLLPIITIGLFYAQQKMFMPPPTTDEAAMQQKMMNIMMFVFGFLFYKVPAGLCVYFIASSLWGMSERKLLEILPEKPVDPDKEKKPAKEGFLSRQMKKLQELADMQEQLRAQGEGGMDNPSSQQSDRPNRGGGGGGKRGGRRGGKHRR